MQALSTWKCENIQMQSNVQGAKRGTGALLLLGANGPRKALVRSNVICQRLAMLRIWIDIACLELSFEDCGHSSMEPLKLLRQLCGDLVMLCIILSQIEETASRRAARI